METEPNQPEIMIREIPVFITQKIQEKVLVSTETETEPMKLQK